MNMFKFGWLLILYAHAALCSEHAINWWKLGPAYKDSPALGWLAITFLIFVFIIVRMIRKPISLYLETRSKDIRRQIEEGQIALAESKKQLLLYEEKLLSLSNEIEQLKASFNEQATLLRAERQRLANEFETRILKDAEDTIRANYDRAKSRLAEEVVSKAITLATETIRASEQKDVDRFLKNIFISDLKALAKGVQ